MARPVVLLGSSRANGETRRAVDLAFADKADCVTLEDFAISPYDYEHSNRSDDFLKVVDLMLARDTLIFATPVY